MLHSTLITFKVLKVFFTQNFSVMCVSSSHHYL